MHDNTIKLSNICTIFWDGVESLSRGLFEMLDGNSRGNNEQKVGQVMTLEVVALS